MNATPTSLLPSTRLWLLALALTACGIETSPNPNPSFAGEGADAGAGTDGGSTSGSGGGGRSGSGAGTGAAGKAGSAGGTAGGSAGTTTEAGSGGEAGDEAGAGGSAGSAGGEPECDESKSPKDEPCLVADEYAVFVAPTGVLGAAGTMDAPLPTVSAGIAAALATDVPRVIVCGGGVVYSEAVEITAGISVYGGFDCSGGEPWEHTGAATLVQPSVKGEALRIVDVEDPVLIQDMEFQAQDADAPGESSVAAMVKGSAAVTLKGVKLTAGKGVDGANATTVNYVEWPRTGADTETCDPDAANCLGGHAARNNTGGGDQERVCPAGDSSTGGFGGNKASDGAKPGDKGIPDREEPGAGIGGTTTGAACGSGVPGAAGRYLLPGRGATAPGAIVGTWEPAAGAVGPHGEVGQGGGGGGATDTGGGGGGGAGGCGGKGGAAGSGGGASIALLVIDSSVSLSASSLHTGAAGDGGSGDAGGPGMLSGGVGGKADDDGGCRGGNGGAGGIGGGGGGGAGGISVGVVWTGTEPEIDADTDIEFGTFGMHGMGGDNSSSIDEGVDGTAEAMLEV